MKKLLTSLIVIIYLNVNAQTNCSNLKIGKTYTIYGLKPENPFEKQPKATVTIIDIKKGYVQYCWHYDYKKKNNKLYSFYRTCIEFNEMLNNKNKSE